ncbi:MAG: hypothetical protein QXR30_01465 [Candidatus Woesearchaeota archaeon]
MDSLQEKYETNNELSFVGNWFFDISVIGFIKTINYSLKLTLDEIFELSMKDEKRLYFLYFPYSYVYFSLHEKLKRSLKDYDDHNYITLSKFTDSLKNNILKEQIDDLDERKIFDISWEKYVIPLVKEFEIYYIINEWKNKKNKEKIEGDAKERLRELLALGKYFNEDEVFSKLENVKSLTQIKEDLRNIISYKNVKIPDPSGGFYTNFMFFNNTCKDTKEKFYATIIGDYNSSEILSRLDLTVNKFLVSGIDAPLELYTEIKSEDFLREKKYLFAYLICFTNAFYKNFSLESKSSKNYFFYFYDMKKTYDLNLKLESDEKEDKKIFQEVFDFLRESVDYRAQSIYIISYEKVVNQDIKGLEFFEISPFKSKVVGYLFEIFKENYFLLEKGLINYFKGKLLFFEIIKELENMDIIKSKKSKKENSQKRNTFFGRYYPSLVLDLFTLKKDSIGRSDQFFEDSFKNLVFEDMFSLIKKYSEFTDDEKILEELKDIAGTINVYYNTLKSYFMQKHYTFEEIQEEIRYLLLCIKYDSLSEFLTIVEKILLNDSFNLDNSNNSKKEENNKDNKKNQLVDKLISFIANNRNWRIYALIFVFALLDSVKEGDTIGQP